LAPERRDLNVYHAPGSIQQGRPGATS